MRVGFFVDHYDPARGGLERAVALLARRLDRDGHEARIYGLSAADRVPGRFCHVEVRRAPRGELERTLAERSLAAARADDCDVTVGVRHVAQVDVYWPHGGSHAATLAAGEASRGAVAGGVARMLHRMSPRHRVFLALEEEALSGGAGQIWAVSEMVRRELELAVPACAPRIELHANGVDRQVFHPDLRDRHRDEFCSRLGITPDSPIFVFLGTNRRLKGWHLLLTALSGIQHLPWTCVTAGPDAAEAALAADRGGITGRVVVAPYQDVRPLYAAADLLVQPTYRDPCSLSTLEALACGVPVVTTTANGSAAAILSDSAGTVIPPNDAGRLAEALVFWVQALSDPEFRARTHRVAREATAERTSEVWLAGMVASLERAAG